MKHITILFFFYLFLHTLFPVEDEVEVINVSVYDDSYIFAGEDLIIHSSLDRVNLEALASIGDDQATYKWTQISGKPAFIQNPHNLSTVVSGLSEGSYAFRISRIDTKDKIYDEILISVVGLRTLAFTRNLDP